MSFVLKRRIFFWTLVVLFFITAPLVIFYALGYRFSFQKGIFIHAGSITIESNPQNVEITLNGEKIQRKIINKLNNSVHIDGIRPGEYILRVSAPGYSNWSKKITVRSGVSTEFWNVLLASEQYEIVNHEIYGARRLFLSPEKGLGAYVQKNDAGFSAGIIDIKSLEKKIVFSSSEYELAPDEKENIEWSPRGKRIIIPAVKEGIKNYFIVNVENEELLNLNDFVKRTEIKTARWDPDNRNYVFYISGGNLYRLNLNDPASEKTIAQNISSYDIAAGKIYYFQLPGGIVYQSDLERKESPLQITTSAPMELSNDSNYKIIAYDKKRIALFNQTGDLYVFNQGENGDYFKKLGSEIDNAQFSDDGKKMLFWSNREIFVYFTRRWDVQPIRQENELMNITRFAETVKNTQWTREYEHVVFSTGNSVKLIELDSRGQRNVIDLISLRGNSPKIVSDYKNNRIYFIDENQNGDADLHSFEFPEKTGIF